MTDPRGGGHTSSLQVDQNFSSTLRSQSRKMRQRTQTKQRLQQGWGQNAEQRCYYNWCRRRRQTAPWPQNKPSQELLQGLNRKWDKSLLLPFSPFMRWTPKKEKDGREEKKKHHGYNMEDLHQNGNHQGQHDYNLYCKINIQDILSWFWPYISQTIALTDWHHIRFCVIKSAWTLLLSLKTIEQWGQIWKYENCGC